MEHPRHETFTNASSVNVIEDMVLTLCTSRTHDRSEMIPSLAVWETCTFILLQDSARDTFCVWKQCLQILALKSIISFASTCAHHSFLKNLGDSTGFEDYSEKRAGCQVHNLKAESKNTGNQQQDKQGLRCNHSLTLLSYVAEMS